MNEKNLFCLWGHIVMHIRLGPYGINDSSSFNYGFNMLYVLYFQIIICTALITPIISSKLHL